MGQSKANGEWKGGLKTGQGTMKPAHGSEVAFGFNTRFEGGPGSNPEEMIGAALAGCFSMALTAGLERAGFQPRAVRTEAQVSLEKGDAGFSITGIALTSKADVPGVDAAKFQTIAEETKKGCPVSKALGAVNITLNASLAS